MMTYALNDADTDGATSLGNSRTSSMAPDPCAICGVKKRCANGSSCSKRCSWFYDGQCPQCGKGRSTTAPFCSFVCASTSVQANWCPGCAIRQCLMGHEHCSEACAVFAPSVDAVRRRAKRSAPQAYDGLKWVPIEHRVLRGLALPQARALHATPPQARLRQYLNYRAAVEQRLVALQLPKVGHGGEGNELRRYVPLDLRCTHNPVQPSVCHDASCDACGVLRDGFSLATSGRASHYATSSVHAALRWCAPNDAGWKAVAVVRAVVGYPQILYDTNDIDSPWDHGFDSVTVTNGNETDDGTYVFFDNALDLQYLLVIPS